jgi:tetratricopeptide (TPR) repeat protein/transcriptional regulator with XRE-family HTH domain
MERMALSSFGEMLKTLRKRQRLTQQVLANRLGVHRNTIGIWERGDFLPETKGMVLELARHLHLSEPETRDLLEASLTGLSPAWNVPYARNPFFTGREEILETLHQRLSGEQVVALTQSYALHGLGGIGKTHLAIEYTYRHGLSYAAVFWIGAENAETILSSFMTIAELLRLPERQKADQQQIVAAVQHWLNTHRQWLLIWDNVEDLTLLQRFLPATRQGSILITTRRQALGTLAQGIELPQLSPEEGLLLLLRRAKVLSPEATQEQIEQLSQRMPRAYQAAEQLVTIMDGLPLALDQAGAYIEETPCSLTDYLDLFQTRQVQLLGRRGEVVSNHPASVIATWSLSFEKVERANPPAADLLRLCAFLHPDAIPEEVLMQGVTSLNEQPGAGASDRFQLHEALRTVSAYSLLRRQVEERTCSIHRLVQAVLRDGMDATLTQKWMERAVHVVYAVLPEVEHTTWGQYERLLPHALLCANHTVHSEQSHLELASLLFKTASYLLERTQHGEAESLFLRALHIREQVLTSLHPDVAHSLNELAQLYRHQGQLEKAEPLYQRALHIFEQVLTPSHPDVATPLNNLAALYTQQGKYADVDALFRQALRILEQAWGTEHTDVARSLNNLAILHHAQDQLEKAKPLYQRALRIWEQVSFSEHPGVATPLNNLANLYRNQGKLAEAEPLYQRALHIWEQALGSEHPSIAYALTNLTTLYTQQGKHMEAKLLYQQAWSVWEQAQGLKHPTVAYVLNDLDAGRTNCLGQIIQTVEKHSQLLLLHPDTLNGLANLSAEQGKHADAQLLFLRVLALRERALGAQHPDVAESLHDFAAYQQAQGNREEAASLYQRALTIREQVLGPDHPKTLQTRERYVSLLQNMK